MKREDIEKLIIIYDRRLQKLKEQQALAGISVDPKILIEIEDIEAKIAELQTELPQEMQKIEPIAQTDATKREGLYGKSQESFLKKCQKCGAENRSNARFCQQCGQPLLSIPPEAEASADPEPRNQIIVGDKNIQIGSVHGGQVNFSLREESPQVHSPPQPLPDQGSSLSDQILQPSIPFKLQLIQRAGLEFEVRALDTPMGEPQAISQLPYTAEELNTVLKTLRAANQLTPAQLETLAQLNLPTGPHAESDLQQRIGQKLYSALMPAEVDTAFQMALNQARLHQDSVVLQLRFDENAIDLARYPWELIYHRRALLPSRAVELTRYISYPEAVTLLSITPPLRLLYIQPRPTDLPTLPDESEQTTIRQALAALEADNLLKVDVLPQPTYEMLLDYLETRTVHILHFDGHGVFARQCPKCQAMNYPHLTRCQAQKTDTICGQGITNIEPQGYLAFEGETRHVRWVRSETLGNLLFNRPVRLAVLSACRSSGVGGETLFGGTAPALIQAGVPAVVSTQLPVRVDVAIKFMRGFYRALARFESLPAAVNAGRLRIFDTGEWFIPTLYLRSKDDAGYLFQEKEN